MRLEDLDISVDGRLSSPSAARNVQPIADALARVLLSSGFVLEIGSGTGQHALHFAQVMPGLTWQPSEKDPDCLRSIAAWASTQPIQNLQPPIYLDLADPQWTIEAADAVVSINLIHIAPWSATLALMQGAGVTLPSTGVLCLYGPYRVTGKPTAPSNQAFDARLKSENVEWGVRDLDEVSHVAAEAGLERTLVIEMPANNLLVAFLKR